jgi:hypothetical protein
MDISVLRKLVLVVFVATVFSAPAFSGEEIQLAAAIGSSTTGTTSSGKGAIGSSKKDDDDDGALIRLPASGSKVLSTGKMVTIGVGVAAGVALLASSSSTSNH